MADLSGEGRAEVLRLSLGNLVNLHRERKARARKKEAVAAEENRIRFGRAKAERTASRDTIERTRKFLDGHALTERDENEKPRG
ncbi:DUF4169 family protein [Xanthobacter sp. KR7-225]|uniref:DUF4169 family protein n=1 Tax=Xanthobacter sp. KR7-225 TaxID=3156613 RepID=UPI0032B478D1